MSSSTGQKEYLKKYLEAEKKKKKIKIVKGKGTRIVDDDAVATVPVGNDADEGVLDAPDERPQVVSVTSDGPPASSGGGGGGGAAGDKRWKTLEECDLDELESQREILSESLKLLEGSAVATISSDDEPARGGAPAVAAAGGASAARRRHDSDSDSSDSYSDSRSRRDSSGSDSSGDSESPRHRRRPRRDSGGKDSDASPPRRRTGGGGRRDSDESPPRRTVRRDGGGESPAKRRRPRADSDSSPARRRPTGRRDADSDESPPRKKHESMSRRRHDSDASPPRRRADRPSESGGGGGSAARRKPEQEAARRRPDEKPRAEVGSRDERRGDGGEERRVHRRSADTSACRPRTGGEGSRDSPPNSARAWRRPQNSSRADSPPGAPPTHTQDGKRAGLQDINILREENRSARARDQQKINEMDEGMSGRHAETKIRGRKLQENKDRAAKAEEEAKAKERKKKYDAWGKGLKQAEERRVRSDHQTHEAAKPLARYADDTELDAELKQRQRRDDPMADYIQRKKAKQPAGKERPRYNKSEPPPNRYGIWPGYRWDGVDRSNGWEKQLVLRKNAKVARDLDAYKWSTEDM